MNRRKIKETVLGGLIRSNPTFVLVLGTCPTIAMTTSLAQAFAMGLATTFVLIFSNIFVSLLRGLIPDKVRIPCYIVIISTFVIIVQMVMRRYLPELYSTMQAFIALIVVNCIILARAEAFASKNGVLASAMDGIGMGLGFTLALMLIGSVRELIGNGSIFGQALLGASYEPMLLLVLAPGAFITFGLLLGIINAITARSAKKKARKGGNDA